MSGHLRIKLTRQEAETIAKVLPDIEILNVVTRRFSLTDSDICNRASVKIKKELKIRKCDGC